MSHHKRGKPKSGRAGCLLCYPHKRQGQRKKPRSRRALAVLSEPISELILDDSRKQIEFEISLEDW